MGCPTNLGTGMRASVHCDLAGWTKEGLPALKARCEELKLQPRGTRGESGGQTGITYDFLSSRSSGNQGGSWMLNLHFMEQDIAILGDLDVSRTRHQHFHSSPRSKIGFEHLLNAFSGRNIDSKGLTCTSHLGLRI